MFGDDEVCVFCALALVGALFILGRTAMILTVLVVAFFLILYALSEKRKETHSEIIQAQKQAQLLEKEIIDTRSLAIEYDCVNFFNKYSNLLRQDLKSFIFSSDYGDTHKINILNPDNYPNRNMLYAIKFYYLSDMHTTVIQHNLDKTAIIEEFKRCELGNNLWSPKDAYNFVCKKLKISEV